MARKDVRIITHSVALTALSLRGQAAFLCIGGELRRVSGALVGGSAVEALSYIQADYALLGASGLDSQGCWTTELTEAEIKKAIIGRCRKRIILADTSKWQIPSTIRFADWSDIDTWLCEGRAPKTIRLRGGRGTSKNLPGSDVP